MAKTAGLLTVWFWLAAAGGGWGAGMPYYRDLFSDTWVGQDALGRKMPTYSEVGPVKKDHRRVVGIFYITWHSDSLHKLKSPFTADVSRVLAGDPNARLDAKHPLWTEGMYHWGEPEVGYFLSKDEYVIRKDMSMLADAGVDVLVMDVTNAVRYWDEWEVIFAVMQKDESRRQPGAAVLLLGVQRPGDHGGAGFVRQRSTKRENTATSGSIGMASRCCSTTAIRSVDANGKGVQNPNPHYEAAAKTDTKPPALWRPRLFRGVLQGLHQRGEKLLHPAHHVVGILGMGRKTLCRHGGQLELRAGPGRQARRGDEPGCSWSRGTTGRKEEAAVTPAQHPSSLVGKSWTREGGEPALNRI